MATGILDGQTWTFPDIVAPIQSPGTIYVPLATIRERVTAAGKWDAFAAAVDALPASKKWHLLTLSLGIAANDPDAIALLTLVGCDPAVILRAF